MWEGEGGDRRVYGARHLLIAARISFAEDFNREIYIWKSDGVAGRQTGFGSLIKARQKFRRGLF